MQEGNFSESWAVATRERAYVDTWDPQAVETTTREAASKTYLVCTALEADNWWERDACHFEEGEKI
jgi:hypothetical protein